VVGAYWYTEMPMAGTGTGARLCASPVHPMSGCGNPSAFGFHKQDAIATLTDATVWPMGTPGGSTG
jgi:hypothetical protein